MIRVLIADDHPIVRAGLTGIVADEADIRIIGEAASGDDLLERVGRLPVDVVLLDVSMPGPGLIPVLDTLRTTHPSVRVLILSVHPEEQYATRALRAGARGYLTKDHSPTELVSAIRKVHAGGRYISASLAERLAAEIGAGATDALPHERLSNREFDVLCLLGSGRTVTEIAQLLALSVKTVSTYRSRLLAKLPADTNADLVRYVVAHGLMR
ncbi:MAG: response regulator transcription factor [Gemmatimonadaceae bacterium]|jgi:DNA-binding NarL/FixJ family response regulator|nr:response regulator transcription factor [Gemmatimonadaceae bacterium]